jgi:hypothetical protein
LRWTVRKPNSYNEYKEISGMIHCFCVLSMGCPDLCLLRAEISIPPCPRHKTKLRKIFSFCCGVVFKSIFIRSHFKIVYPKKYSQWRSGFFKRLSSLNSFTTMLFLLLPFRI